MQPDIDARLAERLREIAALEADTIDEVVNLSAVEKARILCIAADVLEDYVMGSSQLKRTARIVESGGAGFNGD